MITWRDIEFAAALDNVPSAVMAAVWTERNHQRQRLESLWQVVDDLCTALTEAESRIADLEQRTDLERPRPTKGDAIYGVACSCGWSLLSHAPIDVPPSCPSCGAAPCP